MLTWMLEFCNFIFEVLVFICTCTFYKINYYVLGGACFIIPVDFLSIFCSVLAFVKPVSFKYIYKYSFHNAYVNTCRFSSYSDNSRYVRGKLATSDKPLTFNQPWTVEEQVPIITFSLLFRNEITLPLKRWQMLLFSRILCHRNSYSPTNIEQR